MNMLTAIMTEAASLKRRQMEREICSCKDETLRANLLHTWSKFQMFLEEDIERALKEAARNPYAVKVRS